MSVADPGTRMFDFQVHRTAGAARAGTLSLPHGEVQTPAFMPVGTLGVVRGLSAADVRRTGAQIILGNTYHLHLRPGEETVRAMGGLHRFTTWDRPMLTDSGGFQVFSLEGLRRISEDGVEFQSHVDGTYRTLTPERATEIQWSLGADVAMAFDHVVPGQASHDLARDGMEQTLRWLERCRASHERLTAAGQRGSGAARQRGSGVLQAGKPLNAGRHPSALLLNRSGTRLFVASASTDRVAVIDTRTGERLVELLDPPPAGPDEGSTPNALALSPDGTRLYVAEADNNAVAVFDLTSRTSDVAAASGDDRLRGRIPVDWYPTALAAAGDSILVLSAKGRPAGANPDGPQPLTPEGKNPRTYSLGQLTGTLAAIAVPKPGSAALDQYTARVARANRWDRPPDGQRSDRGSASYPPIEHVIYVIKENRTYDQVLGDLPIGDGDTSLVFFPRPVSPNHHVLAERFGVYDRFFVNAEVSADGHNWSTAAYATDYVEKTSQSHYSDRGRTYDYEGTNRSDQDWARQTTGVPDDDVSEPANGYLWNLAQRAGISFRNYGEFVISVAGVDPDDAPAGYRGSKPFLATHTHPSFPGFNMDISDQRRADLWIEELGEFVRRSAMPQLEIVRLPNDHTAGAEKGKPTPRAYMADNDLALGRMVEALSRSPFWRSTVMFVLEDDAQNGPDHVDSHRSPLLVISPWARAGVHHRWANTTDVIATIAEILQLGSLSQFDFYGEPLREVWRSEPDVSPYTALVPAVPLDERNLADARGSAESEDLDLAFEDRIDDDQFNRILWKAIKGDREYPGPARLSAPEWTRGSP